MSRTLDMLLKYPSVVSIIDDNEFYGYLPVSDVDYEVCIQRENGFFTIKINEQLQEFKKEIQQLLLNTKQVDIVEFLDGLKAILLTKKVTITPNLVEIYNHVLVEYVEFREFYINTHSCAISKDLSEIRILHADNVGRVHNLLIIVDLDREGSFKVEHYLPESKNCELFNSSKSIKTIYQKFLNLLQDLQPFFDAMDSLDSNCWILDPEKPTRKDCYRRIGFDVNVSMVVTIDPWKYPSIPQIRFLGPERLVEEYKIKTVENLIKWNFNGDFLQEVLKLIELPNFPTNPLVNQENEVLLYNIGECCICFCLRLNEKLPDIICENESCEQFFHKECLHQWLISVNAKHCFNELHGQCPNCEKHISCPM